MLHLHTPAGSLAQRPPDLSGTLPSGVVWVDIQSGDAAELAYIERVTGLHIPTLAELSEIENSSRLRTSHGALYLSVPLVAHAQQGMPVTTPVGLLLTRNLLVTVRFAELTSFNAFAANFAADGDHHPSAAGAFIGLMEALIDRVADVLEGIGSDLDRASQAIFCVDTNGTNLRLAPAKASTHLRDMLRRIGQGGDLASKIRDSLLGLTRILAYVETIGADYLPSELLVRIKAQRQDTLSLTDYNSQLANKVQLLIDATMGFINIEQNNIIKVLTVVSVVGVPPTLFASIYGMNFRHMPELDWAWGYPYGLGVIVLSAILPILWFKVRGWL